MLGLTTFSAILTRRHSNCIVATAPYNSRQLYSLNSDLRCYYFQAFWESETTFFMKFQIFETFVLVCFFPSQTSVPFVPSFLPRLYYPRRCIGQLFTSLASYYILSSLCRLVSVFYQFACHFYCFLTLHPSPTKLSLLARSKNSHLEPPTLGTPSKIIQILIHSLSKPL